MVVEIMVKWKETGRNEGLIDNCRLCIGSFCDVTSSYLVAPTLTNRKPFKSGRTCYERLEESMQGMMISP